MFKISLLLVGLLTSSCVLAFGNKYESLVDEKILVMWRLNTSSNELSYCTQDFSALSTKCHNPIKISDDFSLVDTAQGFLWLIDKSSGSTMFCSIDYARKKPTCSRASR